MTAVVAITTATIASHLLQARIDLLLSFAEDGDQVTSLLSICKGLSVSLIPHIDDSENTYCQ